MTYHYDAIGQLDTLRNVLGGVHTYAYDLDGRIRETTGGLTEQRFYDIDGRMIRREDDFHSDTLRYDARGKVLRAGTRADSTHTRYFGLGAVAWSQTRRYFDQSTHPEEQYVSDGLGNVAHVYRRVNGKRELEPAKDTRYVYEAATGRLLQLSVGDSASNLSGEVVSSGYDAAGNQLVRNRDVITSFNSNPATLRERMGNYYAADGKLRVADRRTCIFDHPNNVCQTGWGPDFNDRQAFEEYRYDALGRRVLLRTRGEWGCGNGPLCRKLLQRFVWDGDQLLYEVSAPGGTGELAANMERDVNQPLPHQSDAITFYTGRVAYTHGLGLDAPLGLLRMEYSDSFPGPFGVTPAATWRGDYDTGTGLPCTTVMQVGPEEDPTDTTFVQVCAEVQWPAPYLWITKLARQRAIGPRTWMGSLIENKRDLTGHLYMRNRYYDPAAGRFTQEDPIGLAGGLNLYGFANGDPVNFSDPFGLVPWCGPLALVCARAAVWVLGTAAPFLSRMGGAMTGLSAGPTNPRAAATLGRLSSTLRGNIDKVDDINLSAAARELAGEVVARDPSGRAYDHVTKVRSAMQGLRNVISGVENLLERGRPTAEQAEVAVRLRQQAIEALRHAEEALRQTQTPQ